MSLREKTICKICYADSNPFITLPCRCSQICTNCLGNWIFSKISPNHYKGLSEQIPCPVETCQKHFALFQVYSEIQEPEKSRINQVLFKRDLNKEPHLQKDPKEDRNFALKLCPQGIQCGLCKTKRRNNNRLLHKEVKISLFKKFLCKFRNIKNEILTFFWKVFHTKKCPDCKVRISREPVGCKIMKCAWCCYQFCWYCFKDGKNCYHKIQKEESGKPRPKFDLGLSLVAVIYAVFCLAMVGALWAFKTIGSRIISGLVFSFE